MCGICGYLSKKKISVDELIKMNDTMYHRGPDDHGAEVYDVGSGYALGLAQRRLSIQDLSPLGHQPMHSKDKRISLVFNGEIYNFHELQKELSDYDFVSTCDTEVIIAAYLKWGIQCVNKIHGMFAIALYDREIDTLYLARDRIGKKPLYYQKSPEGLVFASELKPIMTAPGFQGKINEEIIGQYLFQLYINAPNSIFKNVYKVQPGEVLEYRQGDIKTWKYWDIATVYAEKKKEIITDYAECKEMLKAALLEATRKRMIADVPLGAFLSGGYDSSLITAMAQSISSEPVKTFSIGFNEEGYNEAIYAKKVSEYLGTKHTEMYIDEDDMLSMVADLPQYYDEPFADSSQIATMLVSKLARQDVTVTLSGDGGDEFFCGYNIYPNVAQAQQLDLLGGLTYHVANLPGLKQMGVLNKLPFKVQVVARNRNPLTKTQISGFSYIRTVRDLLLEQGVTEKFEIEDRYAEKNWQIRRMLVDMDTYLPGDILCKVDRASMKYSLESRCPILDTDVMELSFRIPHEYKYSQGIKKKILKDIAYDYIPKELLDRPKVGFGVPIDKWLRGPLREELLSYCDESFLKNQYIFKPEKTKKFIENYLQTGDKGRGTGENYSKIVWSYFALQQWYTNYMRKGL